MTSQDTVFTPEIKVEVTTEHVQSIKELADEQYAFIYHITITNSLSFPVKLLSRNWLITDANGKTSKIQGDGVIGKQPTLSPDESYTYSSGAIIETPVGTMQGSYIFIDENKHMLQAQIPLFRLAVPNILN